MHNQKKACAFALLAVLFWSTIASAFNLTLRHMHYMRLLLYASAVTIIVLFVILIISNKTRLLTQCSIQEYARSALLGFLNPFLYYAILLKAYSMIPAQEAGVLNYTWPLMLVLLSIPLLKQRPGVMSIVAIVISFAGVCIIGTRGNLVSLQFNNTPGVLLAAGSSVIWALFWIFNVKDNRDETVKLFMNFVFGFVFILAANLILFRSIPIQFKGLAGAVYIGLFEMGITFVLWLSALKYSATTAKVSNLIFLSPFISLFFIRVLVGETILVSTVVGLIFIISGIILQQYGQKIHRIKQKKQEV